MKKIFAGLVLLLISVNISFDIITVGLFPDFAGCILIVRGLSEIEDSVIYPKLKVFFSVLIGYTALLYAMDMFGISSALPDGLNIVLALISLLCVIVGTYFLSRGVAELERNRERRFGASRLMMCWLILAVCKIAAYGLFLINLFWITGITAGIIGAIFYLSAFYRMTRIYT